MMASPEDANPCHKTGGVLHCSRLCLMWRIGTMVADVKPIVSAAFRLDAYLTRQFISFCIRRH